MNGSSVLVTGGAGFIGGHLAATLAKKTDVTILDDLSSGRRAAIPSGMRLVEADIRDPSVLDAELERVDIIYHQAALVSVDRSIQEPKLSHAINVTGTVNVLDAARRTDTRGVIASSAAIYGHPHHTPIDESHPTKPTSPYGVDKLATDHLTRLYHDLYDLDTVALRYFNVYGPGQTGDYAGVITVFIEQALADEPITVHGDGSQTRDFVFVDDVVEANLAAAGTRHVGEAFNIGTGTAVSIRDLAELIRDIADSDAEIVHTDPRDGDIEQSVADITKAQAYLDFEPDVSLEDGLEATIEWFRSRGDPS